jgi:hypothetical protein
METPDLQFIYSSNQRGSVPCQLVLRIPYQRTAYACTFAHEARTGAFDTRKRGDCTIIRSYFLDRSVEADL